MFPSYLTTIGLKSLVELFEPNDVSAREYNRRGLHVMSASLLICRKDAVGIVDE
jgi:hypothetical protein